MGKKLFSLMMILLLLFAVASCNEATSDRTDDNNTSEGGENTGEGDKTPDGGSDSTGEGDKTPDGGGDSTGEDVPSTPENPPVTDDSVIDMSGISFEGATFAYSGYAKSIYITGELPEGVTVSYSGNKQTAPGSYIVTATFTAPEGKQTPASMIALMRINEPTVKEGALTFVDAAKTFLYRMDASYTNVVFCLPDSVKRIDEDALIAATSLRAVYVSDKVTYVGPHAMGFTLTNGKYEKIDGFLVYCHADSAAMKWCERNGIAYTTENLPRVYTTGAELTVAGNTARNYLASLITKYDIDLSVYGALFDEKITLAATDALDAGEMDKEELMALLNEHFLGKRAVTVTIRFVDGEGESVAPSRVIYPDRGASFRILTPAVNGYYTRTVYLTDAVRKSTTIDVLYKAIPKNADGEQLKVYLDDIVCWGDSITAGAHSTNVTTAAPYGVSLSALGSIETGLNYVDVMSRLIRTRITDGLTITNCGVGGETSAVVAARAGAETYHLYLENAVTLSGGGAKIAIGQYAASGRLGILRQGGGNSVNDVTIQGKNAAGETVTVKGRIEIALTADAPNDASLSTCDYKYITYTFVRTDGQSETVYFDKGAKIVTSGSYLYDGQTCIIFIGQNGGYANPAELIKQQEEILASCGNPEFYLIVSTHSGTTASRKALSDALTARWGRNYINMGTELNAREAYELAGYSDETIATVESLIAEGKISELLSKDGVHPNAVGYALVANILLERLIEIGTFDALYDYYDSLSQ